jgi:hypothetical protein
MNGFSRFPILIATVVASAALCASAQAAIVTVGSPLTGMTSEGGFAHQPLTFANSLLPEPGALVASPIDGTVVRWRIIDASGGPFKLRVLHPAGGGTYTGAGTSSAMTPSGTGIQTFATNLPIQAGDLIGLDLSHSTDMVGVANPVGSQTIAWEPPLEDGSTSAPTITSASFFEVGFNADVQPPPTITAINPTSGPIAGGTSVLIAGHDFTEASAVKFGPTAASGFTVDSEGQITAISPAASAGPVGISVTTIAGTASSTQQFTYTAPTPTPSAAHCVVPKLKGKKLKLAKEKIRFAGCGVGLVSKKRGVNAKTGKVIRQVPKAGKVSAAGTKVSVKLG